MHGYVKGIGDQSTIGRVYFPVPSERLLDEAAISFILRVMFSNPTQSISKGRPVYLRTDLPEGYVWYIEVTCFDSVVLGVR